MAFENLKIGLQIALDIAAPFDKAAYQVVDNNCEKPEANGGVIGTYVDAYNARKNEEMKLRELTIEATSYAEPEGTEKVKRALIPS